MSVLSILAVAVGDHDDQAALALAADLAKRHASDAIVVNAFQIMAPVLTPMYAGGAIRTAAWQAVAQEEAAARAKINDLARVQAQRFGLATAIGDTPAMVVAPEESTAWASLMRELPLADLVVVGQSSASGLRAWTGPLGEALMEAKAPVLVARGEVSAAGRSAAVAWDGSLQAARAVRAALPLLKEASEVAILQDPDELDTALGSQADPARLRRYLGAHGVAVGKTLEAKGRNVGRALLDSAAAFGAALLVAGAYGHSRLGEALFGGATRTLLEAEHGPHLLISH
jgi:nucleotide-binding universal stress UspA family protein